ERRADTERGIHDRMPQFDPEPPPRSQPKIIRVVSEKTFLDIQLLDDEDKPLTGRKYRLELPDGPVEQGRRASDGRIQKHGIDPGIGRLPLLAETGAPLQHEELASKPPDEPDEPSPTDEEPAPAEELVRLRIRVQDVGGDPATSSCS